MNRCGDQFITATVVLPEKIFTMDRTDNTDLTFCIREIRGCLVLVVALERCASWRTNP
jgi:hypothetical protein